jgi:hypothetical protein
MPRLKDGYLNQPGGMLMATSGLGAQRPLIFGTNTQ